MKIWNYGKEEFPKALRTLREETGMSQLELSSESGLDQAAISRYELGERTPSMTSLLKIASALEVDEIRIEIKGR